MLALVRNGADLHQVDYDGRTVLHMASGDGHYKMVEILLDQVCAPSRESGHSLASPTPQVQKLHSVAAHVNLPGSIGNALGAWHLVVPALAWFLALSGLISRAARMPLPWLLASFSRE